MPCSGNPAEFRGWASTVRSMMYEAGLGKVMSGTEKATEASAGGTETPAAAFENVRLIFKEKNGILYARPYLATTARMDFQVLRLRSFSPSLRFGLTNSARVVVLSLPCNRSTALMELVGCRNCRIARISCSYC